MPLITPVHLLYSAISPIDILRPPSSLGFQRSPTLMEPTPLEAPRETPHQPLVVIRRFWAPEATSPCWSSRPAGVIDRQLFLVKFSPALAKGVCWRQTQSSISKPKMSSTAVSDRSPKLALFPTACADAVYRSDIYSAQLQEATTITCMNPVISVDAGGKTVSSGDTGRAPLLGNRGCHSAKVLIDHCAMHVFWSWKSGGPETLTAEDQWMLFSAKPGTGRKLPEHLNLPG